MTPLEVLEERLAGGAQKVRVAGLSGASQALVLSRLLREGGQEGGKRVYLYLAPGGREAARLVGDLRFFLGTKSGHLVWYLPPADVLPFTPLSPHNDVQCQRIRALWSLTHSGHGLLVTTAAAALSRLPPKSLLSEAIHLKTSTETDRGALLQTLTSWGYQQVPLVLDRGNFAVRGALIDLFSPLGDRPVRVEWEGDAIESIREFDPQTQKSMGTLEELRLIPAREIPLNDETVRSFTEALRARAEAIDLKRPLWAPLIEKIRARIPFPGMETFLPFFFARSGGTQTLQDWLPDSTLFVVDDLPALFEAADAHRAEVSGLHGGHPIDISEIRLSPEEFQRGLASLKTLEFVPFGGPNDLSFGIEPQNSIRREIGESRGSSSRGALTSAPRAPGRSRSAKPNRSLSPLAPLTRRLDDWLSTDRVVLVASSEAQGLRLKELIDPHFPDRVSLSSESFPELSPQPGRIQILVGELSGGFRFLEERLSIVTDTEIFGPKSLRPAGPRLGPGLSSFAELKEGDPIVHRLHGIGIYRGLVHMKIEGTENDYLLLEYRGGDRLYLPVTRMNLVQRYTGADGRTPRIDRLGGTQWIKLRGKAEKAIREVAGELLNLYAARTAGKGFAFSPPDEVFEAFEASFPFEETADQQRAIEETLSDMQRPRPMDRLILGDVGYGKTEVAMRAAFRAALDGKQTALLVPTTLLAFQHHERFVERFRDYPVKIEMLSRFRSPSEQRAIVRDTSQGKIDILIGTHRMLQPDLSFKNLGLLVIDEEHRFGVGHKERIKRLKKDVDVLALSATPIPRTLYISVVGLRSLSVIETPPSDRLAIRTFVMPVSDAVIREAILREIKRGGQVFFVHNEVETIGAMKERLARLVPEATIEVGHGQMKEEDLEEVMVRFFHQKFDLLLCTTIIESGIDIPTANTILIHQADRFGLAQIYQLRGRVGRGSHRAFAYLLLSEEKALTPEASQRLAVLHRFSELGSGYRMASYDLEIRGAGNLLGEEQSGQMTAIGFELYTELLEEAVRELKGEKVLEEIDPELHLPIAAFLPQDYIPDPPVRLELYRRLASVPNEEDLDPILDEIRDRFGRPPLPVEHLLALSGIKALARRLRIKQIRYDRRSFVYAFDPSSPLPPEILTQLIKKDPRTFRLAPDLRLTVRKPLSDPALILLETRRFLRELVLRL